MRAVGEGGRGRTARRLRILALGVLAAVAASGVPPVASARATAPTSGALFGMFPGRNPGHVLNAWTGPDLVTYVAAMNRWQGRANGVINTFGPLADTTNPFLNYFPTIWNTHGAVPMYSMVQNDWTNQQILNGDTNSDIDRFRTELDTWINGTDATGVPAPPGGRRIYLRLHFEANTSHLYTKISPAANATDCADLLAEEQDYKAAWQHIHDRVMGSGLFTANQVQWVFSVFHEDVPAAHLQGCANGASDITANIFPGDDYVDWLGIDGFTIQQTSAPDNRTPAAIFGPMADKLRTLSSRPMSLNEVGTSTTADTNLVMQTTAWKDQWLEDYFAYMVADDVRMSIWNNIVHAPVDWAVFTPDDGEALTGPTPVGGFDYFQSRGTARYTDTPVPVTYNVYDAYKAGVNTAWFTAPDPTDPRLISDPVFRGTW